MNRLIVLVEGETEETFVNELLRSHLTSGFGYHSVGARRMGFGSGRGGIPDWPVARRDILRHLKQDRERLVTTMVDFYALPRAKSNGWPGRTDAGGRPFAEKAAMVQDAVLEDVANGMDRNFDQRRFIPFVVMHEFEGLLFSDCILFAEGIGRPHLAPDFQAIRDQFATPEEINDSPHTAPSKQVEALVPGYEKPLLGALAALEMGLGVIRDQCPHFRSWLERLEARPQ